MTHGTLAPEGPSFSASSTLDETGLALALAPALTPEGLDASPSFFHGFLTQPKVYAQCLLVLAEVTRTRYFLPPQMVAAAAMRDPVFTAHGDRLRAEVFSTCNSVNARLDLGTGGLDGGEIGYGTTNVDLGDHLQQMLSGIHHNELLHLDVGSRHVNVSTLERTETERKVVMPTRWVRAFGNVAEIHRSFSEALDLDGRGARRLLMSLPQAKVDAVWIQASTRGVSVSARPLPGAVRIPGPVRLQPLRRLLSLLTGLSIYQDAGSGTGVVVECLLPGATITLALSEEPARGFSGEGSLLSAMASEDVIDDADLLATQLGFSSRISPDLLALEAGLERVRIDQALAFLAASGKVGWDIAEQAYYHRELPHDPEQVARDNPRLVGARRLVDARAVHWSEDRLTADVRSGTRSYQVIPAKGTCTCTWYLRTRGSRGPCKHLLATTLSTGTTERA